MSHMLYASLQTQPKPKGFWSKCWSVATWGPRKVYNAIRPKPSIQDNTTDLYDYSQEILRTIKPVTYPSYSTEASDNNEEEYEEEYEEEEEVIEEAPIKTENITPKNIEAQEIEVVSQPPRIKKTLPQTVKEQPPIKVEPEQPKHLNRALPTFMTNPQIIADTFFIVANREKGKMIEGITGIENDVNKTVNVAISTPKIPEGIGVIINDKDTFLVWNKKSDLEKIDHLRLQLQKVYLAITAIRSLQDHLGYEVGTVSEKDQTVAIEAQKQGKWITIFLNAGNGEILTDFGNFKGTECFEEARALLDSFEEGGVEITPHGAIPKDNAGVPLMDMIQGEITIMDQTEDDRRHILEAFRRSGMASVIQFDSRCG